MTRNRLLMLFILTIIVVGAVQVFPCTVCDEIQVANGPVTHVFSPASYESENITITLLAPANRSTLEGEVNITLDVESVNGDLNLTLFIEGEIYLDYNRTLINPGVQNFTIDTLVLPEGVANFTFLFENSTFEPVDRQSYYLEFTIDNHGPPILDFVGPAEDQYFTGSDNLTLNITSTYDYVYMNVSVNNEVTPEYNSTIVPVGYNNYTINGSRYENGENIVEVVIWTEEGLTDSAERTILFLDHVRFVITGYTSYSRIWGVAEVPLRVFTPYDNVTFSAYVDGEIAPDVINVTLPRGNTAFTIDTTGYDEGETEFLFIAYDGFGHSWTRNLTLIIDNHGEPEVRFISPSQDIVVGVAEFTIDIDSTWDTINLTVYVDGEPVDGLVNITVNVGEYTFAIDTSLYSKWQHTITVKVTTHEGLTTETERAFGFASVRIEEMLSIVVLLGVALAIPIWRWKQGISIRTTLTVDAIFGIVAIGLFFALGVSSIPLMIWHLNLASIWALGSTLVFVNFIMPLFESKEQ